MCGHAPEREASKLHDLWGRDEIGLQLSVEVRAPVIVGVYPMRIARYAMDNGHHNGTGVHPHPVHAMDAEPALAESRSRSSRAIS